MKEKKKKYNLIDVKKEIQKVEKFKDSGALEDIYGNIIDIEESIKQADEDAKKLQEAHVHFRWSKNEIQRCKRIAAKKGLPYQTYIKSILKQVMDKEESA